MFTIQGNDVDLRCGGEGLDSTIDIEFPHKFWTPSVNVPLFVQM